MADPTLEFGGEEHFRAAPSRLYALLTDLDRLGRSIPDASGVERIDATAIRCVVKPGFSFLRGRLQTTVSLVDLEEPTRATMRIHSKGIGVEMEVESRLAISPENAGSRLDWSARVLKLKGLAATISSSLIRGAAEQTIMRGWDQLRQELGETTPESIDAES